MNASNNNKGFQFARPPLEKLTALEARKKHEENLKELEAEIKELSKMIDDLEKEVK